MKCERCKEWHQRTFTCHNEHKENKNKKEIICGECIMEIWGGKKRYKVVNKKKMGSNNKRKVLEREGWYKGVYFKIRRGDEK